MVIVEGIFKGCEDRSSLCPMYGRETNKAEALALLQGLKIAIPLIKKPSY